jgi:hypothetical protein
MLRVLLFSYLWGLVPGDMLSHAQGHSEHHDACHCKFYGYTPSPLEAKWTEHIEEWQAEEVDVCSFISDDEKKAWINASLTLQRSPTVSNMALVTDSPVPPLAHWDNIMSVYTYARTHIPAATHHGSSSSSSSGGGDSGGAVDYLHVPIEPTAAFMRDPRKCWEQMSETYTQSKDYLVPMSMSAAACPAMGDHGSCSEAGAHARQKTRRAQTFLFDAGATLPSVTTSKNDWSGTGWIHGWYKERGLVFDHVYAWEPTFGRKGSSTSFKGVPPDLLPALHFYPESVSKDVGNPWNPLTLIKQLCRPEDVVVFKLDIDSEAAELGIAHGLLDDPELLALVDEFYFELHTCNHVMRMHGLDCVSDKAKTFRLSAWYDLALPARKKGLRMHFWP